MRTKNIVIALFTTGALILGAGSAFAGGPGGKHKGPNIDKRVEKMTEHLQLDEAQAAKIRGILESTKADMKALRDAEGDRASKKEQFKLIRESTKAEIDAVLTPEQLTKAEEFRAEHKQKRKRKHMRRGDRMGKKIAQELDLTDAQRVEVREISKTAREDIRTIVQDDFDGDRKAAKSAVQARRAKMVEDIKATLTPEQAAKFDELKSKRKGHGKRGKGKKADK